MAKSRYTAKPVLLKDAPERLVILGDKTVKIEPDAHIMEFPGGAIEIARIDNENYYVHVIVNRGFASEKIWPNSLDGKPGQVSEFWFCRDENDKIKSLTLRINTSTTPEKVRTNYLPTDTRILE